MTPFTLPEGTPLAGYSARRGAASTGTRDTVAARALALSDGGDELVIAGSDLLIVPENVAHRVRETLCEREGLCNPSTVLFNASHTHSGPGSWGPGLADSILAGAYDPAVVDALVAAFIEAIQAARSDMAPASFAAGSIDVPEHVRNRSRDAGTDPELSYFAVRREDGTQCVVASYSAHATTLGADNLEFSGDYPGYFMRSLERETGGFGMFLAGAVGSTSPRIEGADDFARAQALGEALAAHVVRALPDARFEDTVDVAAIGASFVAPSYQIRLTHNWRLSPLLFSVLGVDGDLWIHGARIGDVFLYATPCDMSGQIAVELKAWAEGEGVDLWVLSFNGDYAGYVSPDRYYDTAQRGADEEYEMFTMSWLGPYQEALFTEVLHELMPRVLGTAPNG